MLHKKNETGNRTIFSSLSNIISLKRLGGIALAVFAAISTSSAANLSNPQVDAYDARVGTETFAAMYNFTTNTPLVETAQAMTNMGSDIIKLYLGSNASGQEGVNLSSSVTDLMTEVSENPSYHQVFDMPFRHFVCWTYPLENADSWWSNGYNATGGARDYKEMYDLTCYLLTNYNNSGKTFYLGHWEGDGYLEVNGWTTNPSMTTVQGMIGWLNNRQKAVDDAKAATLFSNVWVYNYAECNRVRDAMLNNSNNNVRVINYVIPYVTNLDYLSYSSYDSQNLSSSDLYTTLNYMQSMLPTNKATVVPGERMWIGEYGWGSESTAAQEPLMRSYIQRLINWNNNGECLPFIIYWEMYSNYNPGGGTNYCLINYLDQKVPGWYLHNYFINDAKMLVAQYNESNGSLPSDTQFTAMTSPLLNAPLSAPVPLTVANAGATLITNTAASVSGTLAQGIYGDTEADIWVYYGTQDGGTTFSAWQHAQFVGINTHFNPTTFTTTLSGLASQTNYFYRFYAQNLTSSAWSSSSSQISTMTVNPASYGSRMKVFFSGYNRGETLTNFPVLVNLSTSLPGFSYQQFASPSGSDLRFTDASGYLMIPFEIDQWNPNGISSVWVNVPSLSSTNYIWAYWGNPTATNLPASSTNGSVWPGYDLVWHLRESTFPYADSTLNYPALDGIAPIQTSGIVGNGQQFNGSSTFLDAGTVTDLGNAFTLSAWVNVSTANSNIQTIWANQKGGFGSAGFALFINSYNTENGAILFDAGDGSNGSEQATAAGAVTFGAWHQVSAAINRSNGGLAFYVDGNPAPIVSGGTAPTDFINNADLNFGRFTNSSLYFNGTMDEARIHSGVDDSNWVWASWSTTAANSTFENYSAVTRVLPELTIGTSGNGNGGSTFLVWPSSGVGYELYTTTNLNPPVVWTPVTNQPLLTNNQWQISLPPNNSNVRFYRIQSQ
jgi:hypothetical protein